MMIESPVARPPTEASLTLADILALRREEFIHRWLSRLRDKLTGDGHTQAELKDHLDEYLRQVVAALRHCQDGAADEGMTPAAAREHGGQRLCLGFKVETLVHEYDMLRECIFDLVEETRVPVSLSEVRALTALLSRSAAESVAEHSLRYQEAQREAEAERARLLERERRAHQEVEETLALLDTLLATAPVGQAFMDRALRYVRINQRLADINGIPVEQTLGRSVRELLPELAPRLEPIYRRVLETGQPVLDLELSGTTPGTGGQVHHWLASVYPVRSTAGDIFLVGTVMLDITDRKRAEEQLRQSEERFRLLVEGVGDYAIFMLDPEGRVVSWNPGAERIKGWKAEEILGQPLTRFYPPEDVEAGRPQENLSLAASQGHHHGEGWRVRKDGSRFWADVHMAALRDERGALRGYAKITRDISQQRRAEEAQTLFVEAGTLLAQSLDVTTTLKSLASLVVSRLADYFVVDLLGEDGELHRLEVAARDPQRQELLHRAMHYPPCVRGHNPTAQALASGQPTAVPEVTPAWLDAAARDAEHRAILEALAPRSIILVPLVARGRTLGLLSFSWTRSRARSISADLEVARGVADRAAVALDNARLYQEAQEAIRAREDVVAIVSHDLRNPLNAILLSAHTLILKHEHGDEGTLKAASRIYSAADRAARMIRDLLDFSQARLGGISVQREPLEFHEHVRRVVEEVQLAHPERSIDFHATGDGQGEWDADRLAQVVTNVVGNALQHGAPGSPVRVTTRGEGATVTLSVNNDGPPIPAELLPRLFEPYRRGPEAGTRRGSLGLGLFITRQIVLGHGGSIEVQSNAEGGTTFVVRLPRRA